MKSLRALLLSIALVAPASAADYVAGPTPLGAYVAGHGLINVQTFCASGCTSTGGTYTKTAGTNQVIIEVVAAGGGSGGCGATSAAQGCVGGSGGGGSYMSALFTSAFNSITMTVGAAGTAGAVTPAAGGVGGTTSAGTLISCPGGVGGPVGVTGAAASFTVVVAGSAGAAACTNTGGTVVASVPGMYSGGGSQAAITAGFQMPGPSGGTPLGAGVPAFANVGSATSTGTVGKGYGWGAAGSYNDASQSATTGTAGGPSLIIVYEFN